MKTEEIKNIEQEAAEMILAFETWIDLTGAGKVKNCTRYNTFFMKHFKEVAHDKAPIVLMFNGFIGAMDLIEILEGLTPSTKEV